MAEFEVWQNGTPKEVAWSRGQLLSISLGIAAYDGQVAGGTVTLPGYPEQSGGWHTGDRISFVDPNLSEGAVLYTGYLMRPQIEHNPDAPTELQTAWSLMDINRLGIGRMVDGDTYFSAVIYSVDDLIGYIQPFLEGGPGDAPTIDATTFVDSYPTNVFPPNRILPNPGGYWSDGWTDWVNDIIRYSGATVYLGLTNAENVLQLHVHPLTTGPTASISISDRVADIAPDVFQPGSPVRTMETADLKDGISGRNGVETINVSAPTGDYSQGGIGWEAWLDVQGSSDTIDLITTNTAQTAGTPRPTYSFTIYNLTGEQVIGTRAGSLLTMVGAVFNFGPGHDPVRISQLTLAVSRDESGNPRVGFWDMTIEAAFPFRGPVAIRGDRVLGALGNYRQWVRTEVVEDDPGIPLGGTETVRAQLLDKDDIATPIENVTIAWSVVQNDYDDLHDDYQPAADTSLTDISGAAYMVVGHNFDLLPTVKHRVKAEPG